MDKGEIRATKRAQEKFKEIINDSKKEVISFFGSLEKNGINKDDFEIMFNVGGKNFYYKKCKNIYIIFLIESTKVIVVVDFLTETEFNDLKNPH